MSESLRDLVVTLSLNSDDFTKNIKTISNQMKEVQSEFTLAAAGVKNYEKSVAGMGAKLANLNQQRNLQTKSAEQYRRSLDATRKKLTQSYETHGKLTEGLEAAKEKYKDLEHVLEEYKKAYAEMLGTVGKERADLSFGTEIPRLEEEIKKTKAEIDGFEKKLSVSNRTIINNANAVTRARTAYNNANAAIKKTNAEIKELERQIKIQKSSWYGLADAASKYAESAKKIGDSTAKIGEKMSKAMTVPIVGAASAVGKAAIDYESAFASVRKTVNATEGEFSDLSSQVLQMSTEVATNATDIAETFAIAGQMGVKAKNLAEFARTMIDLGNSTDISSEDAAMSLSQFANITQMLPTEIDNLGSAVVDLGNNFATTESRIVDMSLRLAGAGSQVGMTEPEILALATALSSVGIEAESGGSAMSKMLVKIETAVKTGSEKVDDFARIAGLTNEAFSALWENDPATAFISFIQGIASLDEEGQSAIVTLDELGIKELRLRDTMLRSVNAVDLVGRAMETSNRAWDENVALANEANRRYNTTASKLKNAYQNGKRFAILLGEDMIPAFNGIIDSADNFFDFLNNLDLSQRKLVITLGGVAAAIGPATFAFGKLAKASSSVASKVAAFAKVAANAGGGVAGFMKAIGSSPLLVAGLTAAVVAGSIAFIDYASGAKEARDAITDMNDVADRWKRHQAESIYSNEGMAAFGLNEQDFAAEKKSVQNAQDWLDGLIAVWTDGKRESNEIVQEWTGSFAALNADILSELEALRDNADTTGYTDVSSEIQEDIDALNGMNVEVEKLLKKRKNGFLTKSEKVHLADLIDQRESIKIKYDLMPESGGGYQKILDQLEAEGARAAATGEEMADNTQRYGEALTAAAQGYSAIRAAADAQYDKEYQVVNLMDDENTKADALAALNEKYNNQRLADAKEYAGVLQQLVVPVWNDEDIQGVDSAIVGLINLMNQYSAAAGDGAAQTGLLTQIATATENLDEDDMVSYIGLLEQIKSLKDYGLSDEEVAAMFPEIDVQSSLDNLEALAAFAESHDETLSGLSDILNNLVPEEVQKIAVDLDLESAKLKWSEFVATMPPSVQVGITGYDLAALNEFKKNNPVEISGVLRVSNAPETLEELLADPNTTVYENGIPIPVTPEVLEKIEPDDLVVYGEDGTIHILVTPDIVGSAESVKKAGEELESKDPLMFGGKEIGGQLSATTDHINFLTDAVKKFNEEKGLLSSVPLVGGLFDSFETDSINKLISGTLDTEDIAGLQTFIQEYVAAIKNGATVTDEDKQKFQDLINFVSELDTAGVGQDVTAGIAAAMEATSWDTTAEIVGSDIVNAMCTALGIHSPSTVTRDEVGVYIPQGIEAGMISYSMSGAAVKISTAIRNTLAYNLSPGRFRSIGLQVSAGLASGIMAGRKQVEDASRSVANASVRATKGTLKIHSPSAVMDDVGVMQMDGWIEGIKSKQAEAVLAISNAARYMTNAASGFTGSTNDNRRTYNNTANASVNVENLYVRDEQDVRSIAIEIAQMTKQNQSGRGMK